MAPTAIPFDKNDLQRIYKSNQRELIDVKPTYETASSLASHTHRFVERLYAFVSAVLHQALHQSPERHAFLKDPNESCLQELLQLVWSQQKILLLKGRHVIALHHDAFLSELNHFELRGATPSPDFIRKDSFGAFLYHVPDDALAAVGCAMRLAILEAHRTRTLADPADVDHFLDHSQLRVRFLRVQPPIQMLDVKTGLVGKLVTVTGHVVKARPQQLRVATADFGCAKCGGLVTHVFESGRYSSPTKCVTDRCRSRSFTMLRSTARYLNVQEIRLQEAQEESTMHAGRTPRQIEVELTHDLVDICRPGDSVMVAAVIAAVNTAVAAGKTGKRALENSTYKLYLRGHSVTTLSESTGAHQAKTTQTVYTQDQLRNIVQLCHADHRYFGLTERRAFPFDLLVRSLCPSIIGHHAVKAGLLLCLLGGTPSLAQSSDKEPSIRSNSHCLIVGDPGMGKSQMLLAASQLAARSVYVGGNTSSTTGLTVTLTKEERGETGIEAGALVLADQGICCIDEFDKMAKSHQDGLLEAMEQQQVSIAKAGVVASLPARCSVIAAANPKHGSYNMNKTVAENLNMAKPILSRFDLVFILRDRADTGQDQLVSSNIMNLYRGGGKGADSGPDSLTGSHQQPGSFHGGSENQRMALSDRLAWVHNFQKQPLPASLVRDYVAYAREYCKPKLTPEAAAVLKEYFMELRYPSDGHRKRDTVPITFRQLEALIRLSQARAKACLREFVLKEDALDVVELMSLSVEQVHTDESGVVDRGRGGPGGTSNRSMKKNFVKELHRIVGIEADCSIDDLRRVAERVGCGLGEFHSLIDDLRLNGVIIKKPSGRYQVLT